MTTMQKATIAFLVLLIGAIAVYDVIALVGGGYESTISSLLYTYAKQQPIIPFVFGVVAGHLFWPNKEGRIGMGEK